MEQIPAAEAERIMKVQEVILRAMAKKITWLWFAKIRSVHPENHIGIVFATREATV